MRHTYDGDEYGYPEREAPDAADERDEPAYDEREMPCGCGEGTYILRTVTVPGVLWRAPEDCYPDEVQDGPTVPCAACGADEEDQ